MNEFTIRAYSKQELALLYFPTASSPHTAVNHLMSWIRRCTPLWHELESMGYMKMRKYFTPREVKAIIDNIGEP